MVKFIKALYLLLPLLFLLNLAVSAQDQFESVLEQSITRVNELLDSSNIFLLTNPGKPANNEIPGFLFLSPEEMPENSSVLAEQYYALKQKYLKSDLGIRFTGNYNNNLKGGFAEDEDIYYNQRTYLGLEWNVMQTGSIGNRKKLASLEAEKQIDLIELKEENIKKDYFFTRQYITASFVNAQNPYLQQRHEVLLGLFDIYQELFYLKRVDWERLLKIKGEIKKVELLLRRNEQIIENTGFETNELLNVEGLTVFGINTDKVLGGIPMAKYDSLKYALKINDLKNTYDDYVDHVSIRPYVRYNFYDFLSTNARSYPSAGVTLNLPVSKSTGKKDLLQVEKQRLTEEYHQEKDQVYTDVLNLTHLYEEKVQDFVYLVYQRDLLRERISRELKKREINLLGFNGIKALGYFDEYLDYEAGILDKKKDIYLRLLDVSFAAKGEDPVNYLDKLGYDLSYKNFPGNRAVYLWSGLFNVMQNDHLITFMKDREIDQVMISLSRLNDEDKLNDFIQKAETNNINPAGLIGNNALVNQSAEEIIAYLAPFESYKLNAIHLDVEPHAFNDFDKNQSDYLTKLLNVYRTAAEWCHSRGMELSVSLPFHYPETVIDQAFEICDQVYIMNYNAKDEHQLIERLNGFIKDKYRKKLVVSIRPSDFTSLKDLDYTLLHIIKNTGIERYCFNDLRGLNRFTTDFTEDSWDEPHYQPYRVESGAFRNKADATALSKQLKKLNFNGQVTWKRNGTYCVVLGYFNNFDAALGTLNNFKKRWPDFPEPWIYMVY
ncbi:SPOR domain-containing protein [Saccharicrinis sp. FJH54]|uniref:SPOR domain-containing protein n=1 Tax=Saccharicrinis sp. FJH54 TaxID=3344665 RepID=UPI0035D47C47